MPHPSLCIAPSGQRVRRTLMRHSLDRKAEARSILSVTLMIPRWRGEPGSGTPAAADVRGR